MPVGVTVARRRPSAPEYDPTRLWAPDYLLAGPCGDVWAPSELAKISDEDTWMIYVLAVRRRYRDARSAWFACHDLDPRSDDPRVPLPLTRAAGRPWSLRESDAAETLARRGLPANWQPTKAPRPLMNLPMHPSVIPDDVRRLLTR